MEKSGKPREPHYYCGGCKKNGVLQLKIDCNGKCQEPQDTKLREEEKTSERQELADRFKKRRMQKIDAADSHKQQNVMGLAAGNVQNGNAVMALSVPNSPVFPDRDQNGVVAGIMLPVVANTGNSYYNKEVAQSPVAVSPVDGNGMSSAQGDEPYTADDATSPVANGTLMSGGNARSPEAGAQGMIHGMIHESFSLLPMSRTNSNSSGNLFTPDLERSPDGIWARALDGRGDGFSCSLWW